MLLCEFCAREILGDDDYAVLGRVYYHKKCFDSANSQCGKIRNGETCCDEDNKCDE